MNFLRKLNNHNFLLVFFLSLSLAAFSQTNIEAKATETGNQAVELLQKENKKLKTQLDLMIKKLLAQEKELVSLRETLEKQKLFKDKTTLKTSGDNTKKSNDWANFQQNLSIQQVQFCALAGRFFKQLEEARASGNEIKVNLVLKSRQDDLDALIPKGVFENWIFEAVKIEQVEDGSAAVIMKSQCGTLVGSGQIETTGLFGKREWRATIPYKDRRFRELAKLNAGQFVTASGNFEEVKAYKPGQPETFYASMPIGEHPLIKDMDIGEELFIADFSYIASLTQ
ncbi:hypothetical protein [Candidatus Ponderosibacter sp. Uisw_141_02]|uniref:hypothetical protein n=1 Tax=Candidatus Ponderosibacter sp. Uisw_141_02 TaxID=3231000 RepID=UPI003D43BDF7